MTVMNPKGPMRANRLVIAFDVDGTLIDADDKPRRDVLDICFALQTSGFVDVVVWSGGGGGADYAAMWARRLGLNNVQTMAKNKSLRPDVAFDDVAEFAMADKIVYV